MILEPVRVDTDETDKIEIMSENVESKEEKPEEILCQTKSKYINMHNHNMNNNYNHHNGKMNNKQTSEDPYVTSILSHNKTMDYVRRNSYGDISRFYFIIIL